MSMKGHGARWAFHNRNHGPFATAGFFILVCSSAQTRSLYYIVEDDNPWLAHMAGLQFMNAMKSGGGSVLQW